MAIGAVRVSGPYANLESRMHEMQVFYIVLQGDNAESRCRRRGLP